MPDGVEIGIHAGGAAFQVRTAAYFRFSVVDDHECIRYSDLVADSRARLTPA